MLVADGEWSVAPETRKDVGASELLGAHLLAGRGLHERRAAQKIVPVPRTITVSSLIAGT